jgi:mannose-6-phosphate isomerase-like protein (cupin superfamily)
MADVTVKKIEELESYQSEGRFNYAGKSLGVTAWGMNLIRMPPNWKDYPDHDEAKSEQEEAYVVLEGAGKLVAGDQTWDLKPGILARVGPGQKRKILPGDQGLVVLALGGVPGKPYKPRT